MSRRPAVEVRGSVAVVSGGARGIGAAIAGALARRGARVAIGDVDLDLARATAERIGAVSLPLDVTSGQSWRDFTAAVEERLGPIDVLVNNAGIMPIGPFVAESEETAARQLAINVDGVLLGCRTVLPGMLERRRGHLVNIASQAGKIGVAGSVTYCGTKWAVVGITHALEDELRDTPVAVTAVLPGIVNTELSRGLPRTRFAPEVEPEEIADGVLHALDRPRREVWIPGSGRYAFPFTRALPPRVRARIMRVLGVGSDPMLDADLAARSAYEARIAESEAAREEERV